MEGNKTDDKPICGLSHTLGDCAFRRRGCNTLLDVLTFVYPPSDVLAELRRSELTPEGRAWLDRLDTIWGEPHTPRRGRG